MHSEIFLVRGTYAATYYHLSAPPPPPSTLLEPPAPFLSSTNLPPQMRHESLTLSITFLAMVANVTIARRQLNGEKRSKKKRENRSKAFSPCYHNYCIEYPLRILPLRSCNGVTSPAFPGLDGNHTLCWWHWTRLRHLPKSNGFSSGWGSISNTVWVGLVAVNSNMRMRTELVPGRGSDPMSGTVFGHSPKPRVAWQSLAMFIWSCPFRGLCRFAMLVVSVLH